MLPRRAGGPEALIWDTKGRPEPSTLAGSSGGGRRYRLGGGAGAKASRWAGCSGLVTVDALGSASMLGGWLGRLRITPAMASRDCLIRSVVDGPQCRRVSVPALRIEHTDGVCGFTRLSHTEPPEVLGRGENTGDRRLRPRGAGGTWCFPQRDCGRLGTESSVPAFSRILARTKWYGCEICGAKAAGSGVRRETGWCD